MTSIAKLFGHRWFEAGKRGWEWRLNWAEITGNRIGLALALCSFEDHYSLHIHVLWPNIFFKLTFLDRWHREPEEGMDAWGFSVCGDTWAVIHLNWGNATKIVHLPWDWSHVRHQVARADGTLVDPAKGEWSPPFTDGRALEAHDYVYHLNRGEVQQRTATIYGEEREWRWRWFQWAPWPRMIRRDINISFDAEVGERTGSWKGGCTGCSTEWRKSETMLAALRRMEATRKF